MFKWFRKENTVGELIEEIKKVTGRKAYRLTINPDRTPGLLDSKFGGFPYWDTEKGYPLDSFGEKMMLLAQINLTAARLNDPRLPNQGMLQFFITAQDDTFGMDFDQGDSQKDFRVVYHPFIHEDVTEEDLLEMDVPVAEERDWMSPVMEEAAIDITPATAYMGMDDYRFDKVLKKATQALWGARAEEFDIMEHWDELSDALNTQGHWLLGYPSFSQSDPRDMLEKGRWDEMLLQMDTDSVNGTDYVMWGDCGVGNFFIDPKALARGDFSRVLYNWDCC